MFPQETAHHLTRQQVSAPCGSRSSAWFSLSEPESHPIPRGGIVRAEEDLILCVNDVAAGLHHSRRKDVQCLKPFRWRWNLVMQDLGDLVSFLRCLNLNSAVGKDSTLASY